MKGSRLRTNHLPGYTEAEAPARRPRAAEASAKEQASAQAGVTTLSTPAIPPIFYIHCCELLDFMP
jgi:hypothetical protein